MDRVIAGVEARGDVFEDADAGTLCEEETDKFDVAESGGVEEGSCREAFGRAGELVQVWEEEEGEAAGGLD